MIKFCLLWLNLFADLLCLLVLGFRSKSSLAAENLFLRKTLIGWHRKGFQLLWRKKCQSDRPRIPLDLQRLIRKMAGENPSWGEERIANELLLKLGLRVSPRTIRKYLPQSPAAPAGNPSRAARDQRAVVRQGRGLVRC
jgi:hypothetical protein